MDASVEGPEPGGAHRVFRGHEGIVTAAAFAFDGRLLLTGDQHGNAEAWKFPELTHYFGLSHDADRPVPIYGFAQGPDGEVVYGRGRDLKSWQTGDDFLTDFSKIQVFTLPQVHQKEVVPVLATAREFVSAGYDGLVCIWRGDDVLTFETGSSVLSLATPPYAALDEEGDNFYAIGREDGSVLILAGDDIIGSFDAHAADVYSLAFQNPELHRKLLLASASPSDFRVRIWDKDTAVHEFEASGFAVAFSPDGRWLAYGHRSSLVVRDARTWEIAKVCNGHTGEIQAVTFSPGAPDEEWNGWLVSASHDSTVRVWSLADLVA